jgi:hypothetical protein
MRRRALASVVATLLVASSAEAAPPPVKTFGAWTVGITSDQEGLFAATTNDSGGLIGMYCFKESRQCFWILTNDIRCKDDSKYPVLVNSDSGALSTEIVCSNLGKQPRYLFGHYEQIEEAVLNSEWIGIAFPLASGKFAVSRFQLKGAKEAVAFVEKAMKAVLEPASGTRDQTL